MKKIYIITVFLLIAWIASIRQIYVEHKKAERMKNNYEVTLSGIKKFYRGTIAIQQVNPQILTRSEAKDLFHDEFAFFEEKLKLKKVSGTMKMEGYTSGKIKARIQDSLLQISYSQLNHTVPAKVFNYADSNIVLNGLQLNDSITINYKYYLRLAVARSLEPRKGLWKKLTLKPLKRIPVYSCISKDTSLVLTRFSVLEVNQD